MVVKGGGRHGKYLVGHRAGFQTLLQLYLLGVYLMPAAVGQFGCCVQYQQASFEGHEQIDHLVGELEQGNKG